MFNAAFGFCYGTFNNSAVEWSNGACDRSAAGVQFYRMSSPQWFRPLGTCRARATSHEIASPSDGHLLHAKRNPSIDPKRLALEAIFPRVDAAGHSVV